MDAEYNEAQAMIEHYTSLLISMASFSPTMENLPEIPSEVASYVDEIEHWVEMKIKAMEKANG